MTSPLSPTSIVVFFFFIFTASDLLHMANTFPIQQAKRTNIAFYDHEYYAGPNTSVIIVAGQDGPTISNIFQFGTIAVADNAITEGAARKSKEIGRLQGYGLNSQLDGQAMFTAFNVIFTDGEFKGSTLQIQGYDDISMKQRELGVVSGSSYFRSVKGYAFLETEATDLVNGIGIYKFNITVNRY